MNSVFVYCEIEDGQVAEVSMELLTKGSVAGHRIEM
jgi:electron transfer flavoprotein alpha subunit